MFPKTYAYRWYRSCCSPINHENLGDSGNHQSLTFIPRANLSGRLVVITSIPCTGSQARNILGREIGH